MYLIAYTTQYRGGGAKFERAAKTLGDELGRKHPGALISVRAIERKAQFIREIETIRASGQRLNELHFLGHSGMYGIMFGSSAWPEQLSPQEWRELSIPFAEGASAYFHACRTARWFAPFFARTFGVPTYGHYGYTSVSTRADRFVFEGLSSFAPRPLYLVSVEGRKTHGLLGSLRKYALAPRARPMTVALPERVEGESYDSVAEMYDHAFADIRVRGDEWRWLSRRISAATRASGRPLRVLDLGCGNGSLLGALSSRIASGAGVDASERMIVLAERRQRGATNLTFSVIAGPKLPFDDGAFDVVTSLLSFRYLDWDPMLHEIRRVLSPGGHLLVVDMAEKKVHARDLPALARSLFNAGVRRVTARAFTRHLDALTAHPDWHRMLQNNPIRAHHEYAWYLESRFPGQHLELLNVGRSACIVAFDSGPVELGKVVPQSYP